MYPVYPVYPVYPESVLLESRSARSGMAHRVDVLDKIKALALSPDGVHATTQDVADYYEVGLKTVEKLTERHRQELKANGLSVIRGGDLRSYETDTLSVSSESDRSYPQRRSSLTLFSRRAVLNVGMLLRDSAVAQRVRGYLLDAEGNQGAERKKKPVGRARTELSGSRARGRCAGRCPTSAPRSGIWPPSSAGCRYVWTAWTAGWTESTTD